MRRSILWFLLLCLGLAARATDLGKFTIPDNQLPWTREAALDARFGGQVIRVNDPRAGELLVILPAAGIEAAPDAVMATIRAELQRVDPAATSADALQLGLVDTTWFGVGRPEEGFVLYRGAAAKDGLVYPIALRVPVPGTVSVEHRKFLRNLRIQRVVTRTTAAAPMGRGNLLLNKKDLPGALAAFDEAVAKDPRSPEAYYFRGMCHKRMKNVAAARKDLDRALALKRTADFLVERAEVEMAAGDHAAALQWLEQARAAEPENEAVHRNLGMVHHNLGQTERAIAAFTRALELHPANRGGRASLVMLHALAKNPTAAAAQWHAFRQFHPGDAYADELRQFVLKENPGATFAGAPAPATGLRAGTRSAPAPAVAANRPKPGAAVTKDSARPPARAAVTVLPDDDPAALAAFKQLPPLPPLSTMLAQARATPVAPRLDPRAFNSLQYLGAVAAVRQAMAELAGPLSDEARKTFDARWAAIEDYPADACIEYLNAASPLLGEILALRAALVKAMQGYDNLLDQARTARLCGNHAAAHEAMRRAGQHAALLKGLQRSCDQAVQALAALGELPDAALIKARVAEQFAAAKSLLRNLDRPLALSGEYEPSRHQTVQDPFDVGFRQPPNPAALKVEYDTETGRSVYYQPLKSIGGNRVLFYVCETFPAGNRNSWTQVFEERGDGVFVCYGGGSDLSRTELRVTEDGFTETEYTLGPPGINPANNDFSERAAAAVAKGQRPSGKLVYSVRSRTHFATGVQYQRPPTDDEFDWRGWESDFRKQEKAILAEFEGEQRAFETLAPSLPFPQPIPAEHIFWVLERTAVVPANDPWVPQWQLSEVNPAADAVFRRLIKRNDGLEPFPQLVAARTTEVAPNGIRCRDVQKVVDARGDPDVVYDTLSVAYELAWTPPPPVLAQVGGRFEVEITAAREVTAPRQKALLPAAFADLLATATPSAGDEQREHLLTPHLRSAAAKVKETTPLACTADQLNGEEATISLLINSDTKPASRGDALSDSIARLAAVGGPTAPLGLAGVRYHYKRRIMTPEEAAALAAKMGDELDLAARQPAPAKGAKPAADAAADKERQAAERRAKAETIAFHETTILYEQKRAQQYQQDLAALQAEVRKGGQPPTADQQKRLAALQFNLINANSNAIAAQDTVRQLRTGEYRRTETPFDVMARAQFRRNIEDNIRHLEAVESQQELAARYLELLPAAERPQALDTLRKIRDEAPLALDRYRKLNDALKHKWQGHTEARLAKLDEDLAWKEAQVSAIENIKTGADTGMMVCSMVGGPQALALTYQFATGWAEKDLLTGVKQSVSTYSDAVDIAWSTYDGYCQGGWSGAAKAGGTSLLLNKGVPFLLGKLGKGGDLPDAGALKQADSLGGALKQADAPPALAKRPAGAGGADDVARYEAELRAAEAQVEGFVGEYHAWRKAVHDGAPEAEVKRLHEKVLGTTAALNGNPAAKGVLKYKAQPAVGRFYDQALDQIHTRVRADYYTIMKEAGYSDHEIVAMRNAASAGTTGMDFDQALKEQPDWIPVKDSDGTTTLRRNVWLTKNGQPVSRHQWQLDAQEAWNRAYRRATGGSAPQAWEKMTSRVDPEAYRMMSVLHIRKDLSNVDEIMDSLDPQWVRQTSDVTLFKAGEMLQDKSLSRLAGVREACRGTAKDLEGKFLPFIDAKLAALRKIPAAKLTASDKHNLARLEAARERFTKVKDSFAAIGRADLPPSQWDAAVALSTGGKGIMETIQDLGDLTDSLFK